MKTLILSKDEIKSIKSGERTYALKKKCVQSKIVLLCTPPFSALGVAQVVVHSGRPRRVYEATHQRLGIDKVEFFTFFENRMKASVMEFIEVSWMKEPCITEDLVQIIDGMGIIKAINAPLPEQVIKTIIKKYFIDKNIPICKAIQECAEKEDFYPECEKYMYM